MSYKVIGLFFGLLLSQLATASEAPQSGRWGAIAFSREKLQAFPIYSERSELMAKEAAISACSNQDCEIETYVERGCVAWATGGSFDPYIWSGFAAAKYDESIGASIVERKALARISAGEAARNACDSSLGRRECVTVKVGCTWDEEDVSDAERSRIVRDWIDDVGGEQGDAVRRIVNVVDGLGPIYWLRQGFSTTESYCIASRPWSRLVTLAMECRLSLEDLDRLYAIAN